MSAVVPDAPETRRVGQAFWLLLLAAMLSAALIRESTVAGAAWSVVVAVAINFFGFFWLLTDSRARGKPFTRASRLGVVFAAPIALVIHLLRTRGVRRTAWVVFLFVLKYIALALAAGVLVLGLSALGLPAQLG